MAVVLGPVVKNTSVAYPDSAGDTVVNRYEMSIPAVNSVTDIYEIGSIPPNCRIIDAYLDAPASLGAAGCVANIAVMNGNPGEQNTPPPTPVARALIAGTELFTGVALSAGAPGAVTRMSLTTGFRITPVPYDRGIGLQFTTRATGTAGLIALVVFLATT